MKRRLLVLALAAPFSGCPAPDVVPPPPRGPIAATAVGEPVVATLGVAGGEVVLDAITLRVPPLALGADTEIELQEVDVAGVEGERAVRFSPDGLVFARAATLTFAPAPAGDVVVGLAFSEGDEAAELIYTTPTEGGVTMPIEHFSDAAAIDAEAARQLLGEDDADEAAAIEADESIALGLGETLRRAVEPAAERAARTTEAWRFAKATLEDWNGDVEGTTSGSLPGSIRGTETLAAAYVRVDGVVDLAGLALMEQLQTPACEEPGNEIGSLEDWVRVPVDLLADLQEVGVAATFERPCVTTDLRVEGDEVLESSTNEVVLDLEFQLVFFDGTRREPTDITTYAFNATGATGPDDFLSRDGRAPNIVFTRPPEGPGRPRVVTIVIGVATGETQFGTFLPPPPFTFVARERALLGPATGTITVDTSSSCGSQTDDNNDRITSEISTLVATVSSDVNGTITSVTGSFSSVSQSIDEDSPCDAQNFTTTSSGAPILGPLEDKAGAVALAAMVLTDATSGVLTLGFVCSVPPHEECSGPDPGHPSLVCGSFALPFTRRANGDYDFASSIAPVPCDLTGVTTSGVMVLAQ